MRIPEMLAQGPSVAVACGCVLGESPVWDDRTGTLLWVDIKAPALWLWRPGAEARAIRVADEIGFVVLTPDPDVAIVGQGDVVARLRLSDARTDIVLRPEPDCPGNRANDATATPDGALLFGTMDNREAEPTGRFYRWAASGLDAFGDAAVITNGPAVDAARGIVYTVDTRAGRVTRWELGPTGLPVAPAPFVAFPPDWGHPDGMAIDRESHVWICHHGAGRVTRFSPDGEPVMAVPFPAARVTKPAFGGPDLSTLFVTSAGGGADGSGVAGHLFAVETGVQGLPADRCRVGPA